MSLFLGYDKAGLFWPSSGPWEYPHGIVQAPVGIPSVVATNCTKLYPGNKLVEL